MPLLHRMETFALETRKLSQSYLENIGYVHFKQITLQDNLANGQT